MVHPKREDEMTIPLCLKKKDWLRKMKYCLDSRFVSQILFSLSASLLCKIFFFTFDFKESHTVAVVIIRKRNLDLQLSQMVSSYSKHKTWSFRLFYCEALKIHPELR